MSDVSFTLNGRPVQIRTREGETLLEALRGRCGIISTKDGCAPQGQCGCCLALVDGAATAARRRSVPIRLAAYSGGAHGWCGVRRVLR